MSDGQRPIIFVELQSRMVFWVADLGMSPQTRADLVRAAASNFQSGAKQEGERIGGDVEAWCAENATGAFNMNEDGVWFAKGRDAVLFKLFFSGRFS